MESKDGCFFLKSEKVVNMPPVFRDDLLCNYSLFMWDE